MKTETIEQPGVINVLKCKCPRCRQGNMFINSNPYQVKNFMRMNETCTVCGQYFDIEVGFYYGSSYVSYALSVAITVITFITWWVSLGFSIDDNRVFYWIAANAILLLVIQPVLMRLSRAIWLSFFVRFDPLWKEHSVEIPERMNKDLQNAW
ncbi:MAG: DUF983 domain-containing protein [Sphingobacteriales bacterium]|nr:DUF983 domain-containing protein [Sphingobacteriales bacterium]